MVLVKLTDARHVEAQTVTMHYEGGIEAFVAYLDRAKTPLHGKPVTVSGEREGITVDLALSR